MSLYPPPLDTILAQVAVQNPGVVLEKNLYIYSNPTPYTDPSGVTNTEITITVNTPLSPYQGSAPVRYKRLSLSDLAVLLPLPIMVNGVTTIADIRDALNANFGLNFVAGDLNDADTVTLDGSGAGNVTLIAQPNSLGWIDQVTLPVIRGNYDLAQYITTTALPGLMYPNRDNTKPFGEMYSYWRDFSAQAAALSPVTTATTDLTDVAAALSAVTGNTWVTNAQGRYSLLNATVVYNGATTAFVPTGGDTRTPNTNYANVLIIALTTDNLGYSGWLMLHYGTNDGFQA